MRPGTKQTRIHTSELPHHISLPRALLHGKVPLVASYSLPCLFRCNLLVTPDLLAPGLYFILSFSRTISLCYSLLSVPPTRQ